MISQFPKKRLAVCIALAASSPLALAQDAASTEENTVAIEEVVVTAQKREQSLQDTPIAISALDAIALEDQKVNDISDVSNTMPNVQIAPSPGGSTGASVSMRGVTAINPAVTWEPAAGIYFDGVFVAKNVGGLFDVAELERVEVLRGPQGTLYGKNTTAGAINLVTRKPAEEFGGKVKLGIGNYGYGEFGATVDSGRLGVARFMVSYNKRVRDGFYENTAPTNNGADDFKELDADSGLIRGVFDVSETVELSYTYDWAQRDNTVAFGQPEVLGANGELPDPKRTGKGALDGAGFDKSESSGHNFQVTWDINDSLVFKSITAHREMEFNDFNDYDGFAIVGFHAERDVDHKQTSQEFQLIGSSDMIDYVAGLYYFSDESNATNPYIFGFGTIDNRYGSESTSYALYGQMDIHATEALTVTLGGRFTKEDKEIYVDHTRHPNPLAQFNSKADDSWNQFSPMAVVSYAFTDDLSTYFRVSQGWRAGGFNGEAATQAEAEIPFDEEVSTSYELGMKASWFDRRLQTNLAIFRTDTEDMQLSEFNPATGYSEITNAGEARTQGFELEVLAAVTDGLNVFFNYGYLDAEYLEFISPVTGADLSDTATFAYAPENTFSIGYDFTTDVGFAQLRLRADYSYVDEQVFYRQAASSKVTASPSYGLLNGRLALTDIALAEGQTLEVGLWGKNLTGEAYRVNGIPSGPNSAVNYYGDPMTVGLDATYRF